MPCTIRQASPADASLWVDLLKSAFGDDHPAKQVYDPAWLAAELDPASGNSTWVAVDGNRLMASVTVLGTPNKSDSHIVNLGRNLFRGEGLSDGSADALLNHIKGLPGAQPATFITRLLASDNAQQILFEKNGYACVGYQPFKHLHRAREGVLFYVRSSHPVETRLPVSESLPQVVELAMVAFNNLGGPAPQLVRDGVTGYPLKAEVGVHEATPDDFELWRMQAMNANPPKEISGSFNLGCGYMRVNGNHQIRSALGQRESQVVSGISFCNDEIDRCVRIVDGFSTDDLSMGVLLTHAVKTAQEQMGAVYIEMDILVSAPRLLKSAEQLGFVPVAYLPGFFNKDGVLADVVKLIKLNTAYSLENTSLTSHSQTAVKVVDYNFQDQKIGVAIINLLRGLPIFEGLGDGELRKIARLFTQKLYRPTERVFNKGDQGNEAYIVMRGQIDICLDDKSPPIASVTNGQIFGEQAFLDGAARGGLAQASQASILLVMQRTAFNDLVQREPHLGMVVMRNIAMDLSNKLRRANAALAGIKR
jgi:CRP/FNR family transcriptional regulator, cyclic AMP receptor protein